MASLRTSPGDLSRVSGEILFEEAGGSFSGATVYVLLEDTSLADAPARVVAEEILRDVSHTAGSSTRLPFALSGVIPDERSRYSVRVHVDVDGDGQVSRGDFITMESYPVLTFGNPDQVTVKVKELR
jgi:uncharacterized lipoprotein YbaY